jgi:NAD(P)-dependent dehydrogenase (short-subunit alcohol dehydrogenase family)
LYKYTPSLNITHLQHLDLKNNHSSYLPLSPHKAMSTTPIALILGSGPNVGTALTTSLTALNYRIATASRSGTNALHPTNGTLSLAADFSSPSCIPSLFAAVLREYGAAPSVVIWNASALTPPPVEGNVLSVPQDQFVHDLNVNTVSPYVAAMEAVRAWDGELGGDDGEGGRSNKTFIYTGNTLNQTIMPVPLFLTLGVGKSASAHWVGLADATYRERGYR